MSTVAQRVFSRGEISPALYSRVDTAAYAAGLKTCKNFWVPRFGGVQNRPGTELIEVQSYNSGKIRLIPFVLSQDVSFVLEFGDEYVRFIKNGAYVLSGASISIGGVTIASPGVVTTLSPHGLSNGDRVYISEIVGMEELNDRYFDVANVTSTTFTLKSVYDGTDISTVGMTTYAGAGNARLVYTLASPYAEEDLFNVHYVQANINGAIYLLLFHRAYQFRFLLRTSDTSWSFNTIGSFGSSLTGDDSGRDPEDTTGPGGGDLANYAVSAIYGVGGEQEISTNITGTGIAYIPSFDTPAVIDWTNASGAIRYHVWKAYGGDNSGYGYIGTTARPPFTDPGFTPDYSFLPIDQGNVTGRSSTFLSNGENPRSGCIFQQRLVAAGNYDGSGAARLPSFAFISRSGAQFNFKAALAPRADDAIAVFISSRAYLTVLSMIDAGRLIVFTDVGEYVIDGDDAGVLVPTSVNVRQFSSYGINNLQPLLVENRPIMVQARGSIFRDLAFAVAGNPGSGAGDLSVYSEHLVEANEIVDWTFQQVPNNIIWAVRDDGVLLSLTYVPDQQIIGWARHELSGEVESVCTLPGSGDYNETYLVVKRTINGLVQRHIERLADRKISDVKDMIFMDAALTYDGRNTQSIWTMTLSGGTTWDAGETITLTSSLADYFTADDVGNRIDLTFSDGTEIRFTIGAYSTSSVVTGMVNKFVPTTARVATATWAKAVDVVSGLYHLEGEAVSVLADGYVVASPNNPDYDTITVTNGSITLPQPYSVIHVGLPVTADIETLDIDIPEGGSIADKKMLVQKVTMDVRQTRGVFVGHELPESGTTGLYELKLRGVSEGYEDPTALKTGKADIIIQSNWNSNGRVVVRQVDPLPVTIGSILPTGTFPSNRG